MSGRAITRRSLLTGTAGAVAAGLLRPPALLAALAGPPRPALEERWLGRLPAATAPAVPVSSDRRVMARPVIT